MTPGKTPYKPHDWVQVTDPKAVSYNRVDGELQELKGFGMVIKSVYADDSVLVELKTQHPVEIDLVTVLKPGQFVLLIKDPAEVMLERLAA